MTSTNMMARILILLTFLITLSSSEITETCDVPEFYINFCAPTNTKTPDFYILNAVGGSTVDNFCQALSSKDYTTYNEDYDLSIKLKNFKGSPTANPNGTADYGHPGVIFHVRDTENYYFVYFRPHSVSSCYQVGQVSEGNLYYKDIGPCGPMGDTFEGKLWKTVKVLARYSDKTAYILLNDRLVTIIEKLYSPFNRGGAMAVNGYENVVFFKEYQISTPTNLPELTSSNLKDCGAGSGWLTERDLTMVATGDAWPASGFCRFLHSDTLSRSDISYEIMVSLYAVKSNDGTVGQFGVMYNVQDLDNFDFVYFRINDTYDGCYKTGFVQDGAMTENSASCEVIDIFYYHAYHGLTVKVKVNTNSEAQIYADKYEKRLATTVDPYFDRTTRFGAIVLNGNKNIVQAFKFDII